MHLQVTVVMPERTPPAHAQRCSELGADVVLCGDNLDDAIAYAKKVHREGHHTILEYKNCTLSYTKVFMIKHKKYC